MSAGLLWSEGRCVSKRVYLTAAGNSHIVRGVRVWARARVVAVGRRGVE